MNRAIPLNKWLQFPDFSLWKGRMSEKGFVALFVFCGACYYLSYARIGINPDVEGQFLLSSVGVLEGRWPTADMLPSYGLLYCGLAVFFKLFGVTVYTERMFLIVVLLLTALLAYYVARRVLPFRWAVIPPIVYILLPGLWHKVFFIFALLLPVAGLFLWLSRDRLADGLHCRPAHRSWICHSLGIGVARVCSWSRAGLFACARGEVIRPGQLPETQASECTFVFWLLQRLCIRSSHRYADCLLGRR